LGSKADSDFQKISDSNLTNRASRELVEMWRSGSQEAARVLLARYEVRLIALVASRLNRKYRGGIAPEDVCMEHPRDLRSPKAREGIGT
jgi:hypothetical protein